MMQVTLMDFGKLYREINAERMLNQKPTLIGSVLGIKFYEHPVYGDEMGMIAIDLSGRAFQTDWYDLPRDEDLIGDIHG